MRRKEKRIKDPAVLEQIIASAQVCRLGLSDEAEPYVVPLCFGYADSTLYFHSAPEGRKIAILKKNPRVCFEFENNIAVLEAEAPCRWSMRFQTIIGHGTASFIEGIKEKVQALQLIMRQYGSTQAIFTEATVAKVAVFQVKIEGMMGKQSGLSGQE